jgi:hypothetical protein
MTGQVHAETQARFSEMINFALTNMGMRFAFQDYGRVLIRGNDSGNEADWGWGPAADQPGYTGKPTVSLEIVSGSRDILERDVGW